MEKSSYIAPEVEIVELVIESGYATSGLAPDFGNGNNGF